MSQPGPAGTSPEEQIRAEFATRLRQLRHDAGVTIDSLAAKTKRPTSTLDNVLHGRRWPRWSTVKAIVVALDGDVQDWQRRWSQNEIRLKELKRPPSRRPIWWPLPRNRAWSALVLGLVVLSAAVALVVARADPDQAPGEPQPPGVASDGGHNGPRLPSAVEAVRYRGAGVTLTPGRSWKDTVHVDLDTLRVRPNRRIEGDDFYYRYDDRSRPPRPTLVIRNTTWLAVVRQPHDGAGCLHAVRGVTVDRDHPLAAGQHLCFATDERSVVYVHVRSISRDGTATLTASAWNTKPIPS
jgi:transcriptional regulator with XRE-family HTH domain